MSHSHDPDGYFAQLIHDKPEQADMIRQFAQQQGIALPEHPPERSAPPDRPQPTVTHPPLAKRSAKEHTPPGAIGVSCQELITMLIAYRQQRGLTQVAFAHVLGVSPRTYQEWEQGRRRPSGPAMTWLRQWWLLRHDEME